MYNIDVRDFKKMLDLMEINTKKVRQVLYDRQYHGCFNLLFCRSIKCCCRGLRNKQLKGKLKELDHEQRVKKRKFIDIITIIKQV